MKKTILTASICAASIFTATSSFAEPTGKEKATAAGFFSGGAVIGAIAGGPIGMVIGALGSSLWHEHDKKQDEKMQVKLSQAQGDIYTLEEEVAVRDIYIQELEKATQNQLAFQITFPTGTDTLNGADVERLSALATYLKDNPKLKVRLDGHADPRGTDEYNNVLSEERALSVLTALEKRGITKERIDLYAHGSSKSQSITGDYDSYSKDRRVDIEIYSPEQNNSVALSN
ncbi:OmpA family protein [Teredinibacter sp. KSP-S5-2]|uniref:OmpA family protein n=1 Tax=Teredinibacter sp. KSP-S5-2 TaxID=3034506 RepID=UPI002935128D|nr:OmpA family protein [Teredinibacter sp. KSP-S5-2]WNO09854.1 OmpA family protein [Teredinibacter sp. KSP-S5-2]